MRSNEFDRDVELIFDHLVETYVGFGETVEAALERAEKRVLELEHEILKLATKPHQGTLRPELFDGLRNVTKKNAVFYFVVDEEQQLVQLVAAFFGGQDHQRRMLSRLLNPWES